MEKVAEQKVGIFSERFRNLLIDTEIHSVEEWESILALKPGKLKLVFANKSFVDAEVLNMIIGEINFFPKSKESEAMKSFLELMDMSSRDLEVVHSKYFHSLAQYLLDPRIKAFVNNLRTLPIQVQEEILAKASKAAYEKFQETMANERVDTCDLD